MFALLRITFGLVLFIILVFLLKSKTNLKTNNILVLVLISVALTSVLYLIPIENLFYSFKSPESSYQYNHSGTVDLIVIGNESDFIVGKNKGVHAYCIVPKNDDGWKISMPFVKKEVANYIDNNVFIKVYQYKKTDDYYVAVVGVNGKNMNVTDNINSEFNKLTEKESSYTVYTYFAYVKNYNNQYKILVDGTEIVLK